MIPINNSISWFNCLKPRRSPSLRLFCFPYAGGGGLVYKEWYKKLPSNIEMHIAQLPGREQRFSEELPGSVEEIIRYLKRDIQPYINEPFVLFGHSMGALISYELARTLMEEQDKAPVRLFVSGKSAPHLKNIDTPTYNLSKEQFIKKIKSFNGTPKEIIEDEEIMNVFEPKLRRDFEVCDTYKFTNTSHLTCPITVFGGTDDHVVPKTHLEAWRELTHTKEPCHVHLLKGDHFFIYNHTSFIINSIIEDVAVQL